MDNNTLTLYKASAGSGKTFTLAVSYIAMLVREPGSYSRILAVTFTNKATAEMKRRILSQLYGIGRCLPSSEPYLAKVREMTGGRYDDGEIRRRCNLAMDMILQDYGHFRIETIDGFFQSILRGLARELQLGGNLSLELDTDLVIGNAVDSFLQDLGHDKKAIRQVVRFIEENIEGDRNWSVEEQLKSFAGQLFKEVFMQNSALFEEVMQDPGIFENYRNELGSYLDKSIEDNRNTAMELGRRCMEMAGGIKLASNPGNIVTYLLDGSFLDRKIRESKTIANCIDDASKVFTADTRKKFGGAAQTAAAGISDLFAQARALFDSMVQIRNSVESALKYLHEMSLLLDIRRKIEEQNRENGRFVLADTASLLNRLHEGDTSFVFEKTGSFTRHIMIDEFQDTSRLQWNNLCILLRECLSQGCGCLAVGDVKQSIYRWRGSDWNIFNTEIEHTLASFSPKTEPLNTNRRSLPGIIEFNNRLFPKAAGTMAARYREQFGQEHDDLVRAYQDVRQEISKDGNTGWVHVILPGQTGEPSDEDPVPALVEAEIDRLVGQGVSQKDITILCRKGRDIRALAEYFTTRCTKYKVTSAEAFTLGASFTVRIITNVMRWLENPKDTASLAQAVWEWQHHVMSSTLSMQQILESHFKALLPKEISQHTDSLKGLGLYDLAVRLFNILGLENAHGQDAYNMCFLDNLRHFSAQQPCDLATFNRHWETRMCSQPIPETQRDGIMLMTIHKSKGLEFHSVIVPYCNWKMVENSSTFKPQQLWVKPGHEPFNRLKLLPVEFTSRLEDSVFHDDYRSEAGLQAVDNLNLLYVAFTRAGANLSIICTSGKKSTRESTDSKPLLLDAGQLIQDSMLSEGMLSSPDITEFESGTVVASAPEKKSDGSDNPFEPREIPVTCKLHSYSMQAQFKQSGQSDRFVHLSGDDADAESRDRFIETGKLMHDLFSKIETAGQADREIDDMLAQGLLESRDKSDALKAQVRKYLENDYAKDWFGGSYTLFNETPVLFRENGQLQNRRPDRVMVRDGAATVVDFKFGNEREDYMHQVAQYAELLEKMGYKPVRAYIWYVYTGKIIDALKS